MNQEQLTSRHVLNALWPPAVLSIASWLAAKSSGYLLFHALAEVFAISVAFSALMVATTSMRYTRNHFVVFVSVAIGWCAGLDLLHTLAFKGMRLLPDDSANAATQLWIAARLLQAASLVIAPILLTPVRIAWIHLAFGSLAATLALLIFTGHFPDAYVEGEGLTPFKVYGEYLVIGLLGMSAYLIWRRRQRLSPQVLYGMLAAILAMMLSEFAFTQYVNVYADANLIGHLLKIHAYWFVFIALVRHTVHEPFVQLEAEIGERERLGREREQALDDLGERIKELRCINAVSELLDTPDLELPQLLQGVVELLPAAFMLPALARARIDSDWGCFGAKRPREQPRNELSQSLRLEGREIGRLVVWYGKDAEASTVRFLPEEASLLRNVARHVSDAIRRRKADERIQRLRYLYEMLSATNRSVVYSETRDVLLDGLMKALVAHGTFPVVFIAQAEGDRPWPLQLRSHQGIPAERLPLLEKVLSDPPTPLRALLANAATGEVFCETLQRIPDDAGERNLLELGQWREYLLAQGIIERAILPLMCREKLLGIAVIYATGVTVFDDEQRNLLREITGDIAFALDTLAQREQFHATSQQAQMLELRFQEVFKASPVAMQIMDLTQHRVRAINDAHRTWLGYELDEIATKDAWFQRAYTDDAREELRADWNARITKARPGEALHSPELQLRCKDGSLRTAVGTVTVTGHDAIVAWTDLTSIREGERALRESEQRFRSMVEQTLNGIYVRREGRYIYVNPRYAEITGWPAEALIGRDVLDFTSQDEDNLLRIREAWAEQTDGRQRSVSYVVPFRRRDGRYIQLGLTARIVTWDDGLPATIVMAEDITERQHAEAQIAAYVQHLEAAMRGTFQAVSNMVEIRDPYTAGHERRVGLIASAIAQEMGWSADRCQSLELLGLVHDIGKISVPSEILTKPTRLSKLEMEMMRGHAEAGYEILKDVPFPTPVAEIIRQHHERMDGSGYPRGLKGDEILPEARVLAVADVIESMASHRPYRPSVGLEAALLEVAGNRGTLYAAEVVDAAVRLVDVKGYKLPT